MNDRERWDTEYRLKGRLWGRIPHDLPQIAYGQQVLEIGCGNGKTLRAVAGSLGEATGIDFSREGLHHARHAVQGLPCNLVLGDTCALPFRDNTFHCIFLWHVLGHIDPSSWSCVVDEIRRVLVPKGGLFVRVFSTRDMRCGSGDMVSLMTWRRSGGILTHYFTEDEVIGLVQGMDVNSVTTREWPVRIHGTEFRRSEIQAVFEKKGRIKN